MSDAGYPKTTFLTYPISGSWIRPNGTTKSSYSSVVSYQRQREDKDSLDTPGWPNVKRDNTYWRSGSEGFESASNWTGSDSSDGSTGSGTWNLFDGISPPSSFASGLNASGSACYSKVLNKLQSKMKDQKFNAGVALAESRRTANLVSSTCVRLARTVTALKRGRLSEAASILGVDSRAFPRRRGFGVPQLWLEAQYGWKPLLSDVHGAIQSLSEAYSERPVYMSVRASADEKISRSQNVTGTFGLPFVWSQKAKARSYGYVEYAVGNSLAQAASQTGVANPLSVAWEMVPWSFVVDWFYPVGTYLNNLDYHLGLSFRRGWMVVKLENEIELKLVSGKRVTGSVTQNFSGGSHRETGRNYHRTVITAFPATPPPQLKNPFSLTHVANGLSLLATAFGRK